MPKNSIVIIAAGGTGTRMGAKLPKQFIEVAGAPIIVHTLRAFEGIPFKRKLVLVPSDTVDFTEKLLREYSIEGTTVLEGGDTRNGTVQNAVKYLESKGELDSKTVLLTHDSVRPFITKRLILECIESARANSACTAAIPAVDTIVKGGSFIEGILNRDELYQVQTPQAFLAEDFIEVTGALTEGEFKNATDCTRLFTLAGKPVAIVKGEAFNIKLTYKTDLAMAEGIFNQFAMRNVAHS